MRNRYEDESLDNAIVSGPDFQIFNLEDAKRFIKVTDNNEDQLIQNILLPSAIASVEDFIEKKIQSVTVRCYYRNFGSIGLRLAYNCISISSIQYYDNNNSLQTLSSSYYELGRNKMVWAYNATIPDIYQREDCIQLLGLFGYSSALLVPPILKNAILMMLQHLYDNREVVTEMKMYEIPLSYRSMLMPYKKGVYP